MKRVAGATRRNDFLNNALGLLLPNPYEAPGCGIPGAPSRRRLSGLPTLREGDIDKDVMQVTFPSAAFFQALRQLMQEEEARFRRLGFIDTTFGVHIISPDGQEWRFVLAFEVFECREAREVQDFSEIPLDYVIRGDFSTWQEMLTNVREHGQADVAHSLNTLTHFGERLQVIYDDPDDRDKLFRFQESIQEFFDLASKLDITFNRGPLTADP